MYVLIAIIFIAELIIAGFILYWIIRADKSVKELDKKVAKYTPELISGIQSARKGINIIQDAIKKTIELINRKRIEFWKKVINLIVIYIILFILKVRFKKAATFCQYVVFLKDCWDSIPV